jgi:hypothetical protein
MEKLDFPTCTKLHTAHGYGYGRRLWLQPESLLPLGQLALVG